MPRTAPGTPFWQDAIVEQLSSGLTVLTKVSHAIGDEASLHIVRAPFAAGCALPSMLLPDNYNHAL